MSITVQQLVDQVRNLSNLRRNNYYSDIDISEFIDDGGKELADIFIAAYEHHFQTSVDFTLAGGIGGNTFALPDDFQKENILLLNPATDNPIPIRMLTSELERSSAGAGLTVFGGSGRRFLVADQTLEVLPPSLAAGDYRLLYTPQFATMAFPRNPDITVGCVAVDNVQLTPSSPAPYSTWVVLPQNFPWVENGVDIATLSPPFALFTGQTDQSQNGVYLVSTDNVGHTASATRLHTTAGHPNLYPTKGQTVLVTAGTLGAPGYYIETAVVPQPVANVENRVAPKVYVQMALPVALLPWQRYLKVYGALTIRRGRQQPSGDLAAELEMLKKRAAKMAANRTEEPKQAPITRGRGSPWAGGTGGGGW